MPEQRETMNTSQKDFKTKLEHSTSSQGLFPGLAAGREKALITRLVLIVIGVNKCFT